MRFAGLFIESQCGVYRSCDRFLNQTVELTVSEKAIKRFFFFVVFVDVVVVVVDVDKNSPECKN